MTPSASRKILIDTDTASDDAVALIMALRSPEVEVLAITVVAGNVAVEQGTRNALYAVELCGSTVPVYAGSAKPLARQLEDAQWFHGQDGLGDHGYRPANRLPEAESAVSAIVRIVAANPGIELITLGPLTNMALALQQEPELAGNVSRCVVMGGAPCCEGNVTPAAEYNFWVDPEAARIVLRSQLPIELVGWQLSRHEAVIKAREIDEILTLKTATAEFAIRSNDVAAQAYLRQTGEPGMALPDPVAMALLLEPQLAIEVSEHFMDVETESELTRGMSVVDKLDVAEDSRNRAVWLDLLHRGRKHKVIWAIDIAGWKRALLRALC